MSPRKKRRIIVIFLLAVALGAGLTCWLLQKNKLPAEPDITISKQTTFLTEPTNQEGHVDYAEAINRRYGKGVTPENNAAVLLVRAFGPQSFEGTPYQKMGIEPPPKEGRYFVAIDDFGNVLRERGENITDDTMLDQWGKAGDNPWKRPQYPAVAAWIEHNRASLELIVTASRKSRFFVPSDVPIINWDIVVLRSSYRILICRAMLRLGEDRIEEAIDNLLACHRLARLFRQQPGVAAYLIAVAGHAIATTGDKALIHSGKLSSKQALEYRQALQKLTPQSTLEETFSFAERCLWLFSVIAAARQDQPLQEIIFVVTK